MLLAAAASAAPRSSLQRLDAMSDSDINVLSSPSGIANKRKLISEDGQLDQEAAEMSKRIKAREGPVKPATPRLKQRGGKLSLAQKPIDWSRTTSTMTAIIAFNLFLQTCSEPLVDISDEHLPLIASLSQESDRKLNDLAKDIKSVLSPTTFTAKANENANHILTLACIIGAIEKVAERINYGVTLDDAIAYSTQRSSTDVVDTPIDVPAALQIWRWEVKNIDQLGLDIRTLSLSRRQERVLAREELVMMLREKPDLLAWSKLKPKEDSAVASSSASIIKTLPNTSANKETEKEEVIVIDDEEDDHMGFVTPSPTKRPIETSFTGSAESKGSSLRSDSPIKAQKVTRKAELSPEQQAKEAEKEEKKRIREIKRAEKAAKEAAKESKIKREAAAKARAANFMSSFVVQRPRSASPVKAESKEVTTLSDFDRVFQACTYKDLAPINRFAGSSRIRANGSAFAEEKIESKEKLLLDFRNRCPTSKRNKQSQKGIHPSISVRESMHLITEASVLGDEKLEENGKRGLANLSDRRKVPMKLLHFASDRRPAWYGTWTRSSNLMGPRNPLGQDPVALDYSYDSDAEWEDEDPNDGDDVQEVDDKEEEEGGDDDSEMDDWLVDDLEEEDDDISAPPDDSEVFGNGFKMDVDMSHPFSKLPIKGAPVNLLQPKKKKIKPIGRRFDKKLVPFSTGPPQWERILGESSYDGFEKYQIEFLNDARPGLNPFDFQSVELLPPIEIEVAPKSTIISMVNGDSKASLTKAAIGPASNEILAKAQAFPSEHLASLLQTIEGSKSIRPVLLEELKCKFGHLGKVATKANIEACLNVYAEKTSKKLGAKWLIKQDYRTLAGI